MPTVAENRNLWSSYPWENEAGHEWSVAWGGTAGMWAGTILPRITRWLPAESILEIAPGYGRCTQYLIRACDRLTIVDLVPRCIRECKRRFRSRAGARLKAYVNDGRSLNMVRDEAYDFVFSWDSLVHVEEDVMRDYLLQLGRKLRPGGAGFLHHSNLGAFAGPDGKLTVENPHWRGASMSAEKFRRFAAEAGLVVLAQELVPWGGAVLNDCFSAFMRPAEPGALSDREPVVIERHDFWTEAARMQSLGAMYAPGAAATAAAMAS